MAFFVYIIRSVKFDKLYIGQTNDLKSRLARHNTGQAAYTKKFAPRELIYHEILETRSEAMKREIYLKSFKNKKYLENFILHHRGVEQSGSSSGS